MGLYYCELEEHVGCHCLSTERRDGNAKVTEA